MRVSFLEKFGLAALVGAWLVYGSSWLGNTLVHVQEHSPAAQVAKAPAVAPAAEQAAAPAVDFNTLLHTETVADGQKVFGKCKSCHNVEKGGANGVGPNMWSVVGGPKAHIPSFAYSPGLAAMGAAGDKWTYDNLNGFLESPKTYVKGTKMSFAGLSKPEDRAAVILFLRAQSDSPPPLP